MADAQAKAPNVVVERWYFYHNGPQAWRWDAVGQDGDVIKQAERVFSSRADCVSDAKVHGYCAAEEMQASAA